jgi:hypothetical protein
MHLNNGACPPHFGLRGAGMRVRLTRRLANRFNGVDLSRHRVGDFIDLPPHHAETLVEAGWATSAESEGDQHVRAAVAANASARRKQKRRLL